MQTPTQTPSVPSVEQEFVVDKASPIINEEGFTTPKMTTRKTIPLNPLITENRFEGLNIEEKEETEQEINGLVAFTSTPKIQKVQKRKCSENLSESSSSGNWPSLTEAFGTKTRETREEKK